MTAREPQCGWIAVIETSRGRIGKWLGQSVLVVALGVAAVGAACGGSKTDEESFLVFYGPEPNGDDSYVEGTLVLDASCIYIQPPGAEARYLLAFADGQASWDSSTQTLVFGGVSYRPGDPITVGGSGHDYDDPARLAHWTKPPKEACDTRQIWLAKIFTPFVRPDPQ
ncbi:MAG: hypothetical protein HY875_08335 [Chloroflexi bacterium]|nr:hypothetical protein [Chloroflexota bacterium]